MDFESKIKNRKLKIKTQEKGYILLIVTLFILITTSLGISFYLSLASQLDLAAYEIRRVHALHIAEIGVNRILYNLNQGITYDPPKGPYTSGIDLNFPAVTGGTYEISTLTDDAATYPGSYAKVKVVACPGGLTDVASASSSLFKFTLYVSILNNNNTYIYYSNSWRDQEIK